MPWAPPTLDDRRFEDLLTEIRRLIPTYAPEWTDHNDADPGITLAQLFAFMTEHLLFQTNRVPDKGLVTFLQMVGAELRPATPAIADITFRPVARGVGPATFVLDAGTRVATAAPPPGCEMPLTFETDEALSLVNGRIADLVAIDCERRPRVLTAIDAAADSTYRPFGAARTTEEELYLLFELFVAGPWPSGTIQIRADVAGSSDVGDPPAPRDPPAQRLEWAIAIDARGAAGEGMPAMTFRAVQPVHDSTLGLTRSGYLRFAFDDALLPVVVPVDADAPWRSRFVLRARPARERAFGGAPPELKSLRLNTTVARHATSVLGEVLGRSTGLPFQRFRLAHAPVLPGSVVVEVIEHGVAQRWHEVEDLFAAGAHERAFQVIHATGDLLFGGEGHGAVPPPDDGTPRGNLRVVRYRRGGGRQGNVGARTLTQAQVAPVVPRLDAENAYAARGGDDEEAVSRAVERAPAVVRARWRAVSTTDFEALTLETAEGAVARARALGGTRGGVRVPGAVTVVVVPQVAFEESIDAPIELPSHLRAAVHRHLDGRRLVTTELHVVPARFRAITVDVTLAVTRGESLEGTRAAALDALRQYFHALVGGEDGLGWPFGERVRFSRVMERLLRVQGVERVDAVRMAFDGADPVQCADLDLAGADLLYSGRHVVRVRAE